MSDPNAEQLRIYQERAEEYDALISAEDAAHELPRALQRLAAIDGAVIADVGAGTGRIARIVGPRARKVHLAVPRGSVSALTRAAGPSRREGVGRHMRRPTFCSGALLVIAGALLLPSMARAQESDVLVERERALLEVTLGLGVGDRSTTGIGEPLLGMGYDQSFGPLASLDVRLFVADRDYAYVRHGPVLRVAHHAGPSMGTFTGHAFRATAIDLGYSGRTELRCMRDGDFRVHFGGFLGITGLHSDADRGDVYRPNTDTQTLDAARTLDHAGLGGTLGLSLDLHFGSFIAGLGVDLHQWFGIDTLVARDLMLAAQIRLGGDFSI